MIHSRILELLQSPEQFSRNDLPRVESEIKKHPYVQNIRALYLYGVHQFDSGNYQAALSKTAAYTTDKKILYQFINKKKIEEAQKKSVSESIKTEEIATKEEPKISKFDTNQAIETEIFETPKPVYINGELNRILFEGEENFLENTSEKIDIEATKESGILVTSKQENTTENRIETAEENNQISENQENKEESTFNEIQLNSNEKNSINNIESSENQEFNEIGIENFSHEKIIEAENINSEKEEIENSSEISFHATEEFMPNIQVKSNVQAENYEIPKPQLSRHEEEMQKLLAEVEAKMQANKKPKPQIREQEIPENNDINFSENYDNQEPEKIEIEENRVEEEIESQEVEIIENEKVIEEIKTDSSWKPMSFDGNTPDSSIKKAEEKPAIIEENKAVEIQKEAIVEEKNVEDSNVPQFINTWQSWLKIDRPNHPIETKIKEEVKSKVIEKFIETEPKISQLKPESTFVAKEKSDDISHLMTETLANIYVEQKLYSKAIKAFEILKEKFPDKTEHFDAKIEETKEIRANQK